MFRKARRRHCRRRAFAFLALLVGFAAYGQDLDCDAAPEAEQRLCWMVSGCAALGESAAREGCLEALAERQGVPVAELSAFLSTGQPRLQRAEPIIDPVPDASLASGPAEPDPIPAPLPTPTAQEAEAESKPRLMSRVFKRLRGARPKPAEGSPPAPVPVAPPVAKPASFPAPTAERPPELPDRFDAKVTMVRPLIHNRQLIALDNGLLFETDRARQSHIEAGDQVRVKRASSRFGRRYQIAGPVRGAVSAIRLRCEHAEASKDTRRKCALLHDRGAASEG